MSKPIGEFTLKELHDLCKGKRCAECPLHEAAYENAYSQLIVSFCMDLFGHEISPCNFDEKILNKEIQTNE